MGRAAKGPQSRAWLDPAAAVVRLTASGSRPRLAAVSIIFISYRRDDSAPYAGRLYDRLSARFGDASVFMDIDQIEPGEDFVEVIRRKVGACETAVVLIGKGWLAASDAQGRRRLDDPEDFVRLEVAAALQRGVRVVPVLVGGAAMPKADQLPEPLAPLARRNAVEISDSRFHRDVDRLIEALAKPAAARPAAGEADPGREPGRAPASPPRWSEGLTPRRIGIAAAVVGVAALAFGVGPMVWRAIAFQEELNAISQNSAAPAIAEPAAPAPATEVASSPARSAISALLAPPPPVDIAATQAQWRDAARRDAERGIAQAQFDLATLYECGDEKNPQAALRWYDRAAAQGHVPAMAAAVALRRLEPADTKEHEFRLVQRETECLGQLQKRGSQQLDEMHEKALDAIRKIKAG